MIKMLMTSSIRLFGIKTFLLCACLMGVACPPCARAQTVDRVIAKLNDDIIMLSDYEEAMIDIRNARPASASTAVITSDALGALFDRSLLLQAAKIQKISLPEDEITNQVEQSVAEMRSHYPSDTVFLREMAKSRMTLGQLKKDLRKRIEVDNKVFQAVASRYTITDAEVARFEQECRARGENPLILRLSRLAIAVEGSGPAAQKQAMDKAAAVLERIRAEHLGFADGVRKYSQAPGAAQDGGDLGYLSAGKLAPAVVTATENLEPGQVSKPIIAGGYACIFCMENKRGARSRQFEKKYSAERQTLLADMRRKARLVIYDQELVKYVPSDYATRMNR